MPFQSTPTASSLKTSQLFEDLPVFDGVLTSLRSLSASAVQGDFRWPFGYWLGLDTRSDSETDLDVIETTIDPVIVAQETPSNIKTSLAPMSFGPPAGFTR